MFQISAACGLALRNNDTYAFNFDEWTIWKELSQGFKSSKYKETIYKNIPSIDLIDGSNIYTEPSYSYNPIPHSQNLVLSGTFQSKKYFCDYSEQIKDLFDLTYNLEKISDILSKIPKPITSVHIRRGDYFTITNYFNPLDFNYYQHAMSLSKTESFLIFSDDINWCKNNYKDKNIFFFDEQDEIMNLIAMSLCDNNIIANSTFSWWGAYLNQNKSKIVIAPSIWFSPNILSRFVSDKDIVPEEWIKI
jgi:hypothetical protein